jgi:hypothetical protein
MKELGLMAVSDLPGRTEVAADHLSLDMPPETVRPRDLQRTFQMWLAAVWLLDAVLQLQPFMFTPGDNGLSGMIGGTASGNPSWISDMITWNASIVDHHPVLTNTLFAGIQFLIAFGIISRKTCKAALALSIGWSVAVWWFGEGLGGIFSGAATPFGGGPGGVLFYAVLAVILWPRRGTETPLVASQTSVTRTARIIWVAFWSVMALLFLIGSGRQPRVLQGLVTTMESGEPGWLAHIDRFSAAFMLHHGTAAAIVMAALCCVAAFAIYLPAAYTQAAIALIVVAFTLIWILIQNFGGILAGGATDPNSGPLVILFALAYWPITHTRLAAGTRSVGNSCGAILQVDQQPRGRVLAGKGA